MPAYTHPTPLQQLDPAALANRLRHEVASALRGELGRYNDETASFHLDGKWSAKQVIGHLIDSAVNNLQRIVRLESSAEVQTLNYDQDAWVAVQRYADKDWAQLLHLWNHLNDHIAWTMRQV